MRNWLPVIRRRLGIVWGVTHRSFKIQRKYPADYVYRLFPPIKDSIFAILVGLFVQIATPEFHTIPYQYFLLTGYIVWASVSGAFYSTVFDFTLDLQRKNVLMLYIYGVGFSEMALGYAIMQTINAVVFSVPFIITLGLLGVNLAIDVVSLVSIIYLYFITWLFFFSLSLVFLGLNIVYKYVGMLQRIAFDTIAILSGLSFSVQILPDPLRSIAYLVPSYYLLTTTRYALINRYLPSNLSLYLVLAPVITILVSVFSIFLLKRCVAVAKRRGALFTY